MFGLEAQGDWADLSNTRISLIDPMILDPHQNRWHRPVHRPDRLCLERDAALLQGRRGGDQQPVQHPDTLTGFELASASSTRWGGAVGVGWEYGFSPNWSAGIEYDHLFMGNANNSFSVVNPINAAFLNNRISQDVDMVTLRFNYRFGGYGYGGPVVAKY